MPACFIDSSGLVKRYLQEQGTRWVRELTNPNGGHQIFTTRLAVVEIAAAVARQARGRNIASGEAALCINQLRHAFAHEFRVIEITPVLATHALNHIQTHALRGSDALHLAAATELQRRHAAEGLPRVTLISADLELNEAARAEGLLVENPNSHP